MSAPQMVCATCKKTDAEGILRCSRCKSTCYCSKECQTADWPKHRRSCSTPDESRPWYHPLQQIKMKDGSVHEGSLELITWDSVEQGIPLGWGSTFPEGADELRRKFEVDLGGDLKTFFAFWPRGFRWTCCGQQGDVDHGCDHHGRGKNPRTCDFCKSGKPLTDRIYNRRKISSGGKGLDLARGPDPRSYDPAAAAINEAMRQLLGMDD